MKTRIVTLLVMGGCFLSSMPLGAQDSPEWKPAHVQVTPLAHDQVAVTLAGQEFTRWHFAWDFPRPYFYPFNGPSGVSLTRMGHPGAPDHDHHASVWFAHVDVGGVNFWGNSSGATIRQKQWLVYEDGDEEGVMAVLLGWYDKEGVELMQQEMVAALRPLPNGERELELQSVFTPPEGKTEVQLGKTNFGFLAVRVAKSISERFGGGRLTNSEGAVGEPAIFAKPAKWMDCSGPVAVGEGESRKVVQEGITFFDHAANPRYPTHWHVRADGWMGAAFCLQEGWNLTADQPLKLRYLLHAHSGAYDEQKAGTRAAAFNERKPFTVSKSKGHQHFKVERLSVE